MKTIFILLLAMLAMFATMKAQVVPDNVTYLSGSGSATLRAKTIDTLNSITGSLGDTTMVFYFRDAIPYISVEYAISARAAATTALKFGRLVYKTIDRYGRFCSADTNNGWTQITDTGHVTITANDTVRVRKALDLRNLRASGIVFSTVAHPIDSCRFIIAVPATKTNKEW